MRPFIASIVRKTIYFFAALTVLAVALVALSRFMSPYLDARKGEMEKTASELVGSPITIDSATVSWFQFQPGVALHNVTIHDKNSQEPILQLRMVKVFISIPKSLWQRKLVPGGILISGADLVARQSESGEFVVQGFPSIGGYDKQPFKVESKIKDIAGWLSIQPLIILRDIDVRFTGATGIKRFVTLYNLKLENTNTVHSIVGKAILHQDISTEMTLAARWEGAVTELDKISGKIYVNVSGMSLAQWFQGLTWQGWQVDKGIVTAKIWATWRDGGFHRIQTSFQILNMDLYSATDKSSRRINRFSGEAGWKKEGKDQVIAGDDILVDWSSRLWPATSFYLKLSPDKSGRLAPVIMNLGYVDIGDMRALLASSQKFLPEKITQAIDDLDLTGNMENVSITFPGSADDYMPVMVQGHFSGLNILAYQQLPAIKNLSGAFLWKGAAGSLSLQSQLTEIRYNSIFDKPIILDQLTGDILWQKDDTGEWKFVFKSIGALNADMALNLSGHLLLPESVSPTVNLSANFTLHQVEHLKNYFPTKILNPDLAAWLKGAFLLGEAQSGSLVLRGVLADFPFDNNNGSFIVAAAVNNVRLHYAPDWPDLTNISGNVQFSGRKILIDVEHTQISGIDAGRVHGEIPYLGSEKPAILTVYTTPIHTDFTHGMNFLHQSPLENSIGKMFKNISLHGPIDLGLALTVPLEKPEDTEVKGVIDFSDSDLQLIPWKLNISKLTGKVNFTERSTDAAAIQGELFGKPLRLDLDSIVKADGSSIVQATVSNNMDLGDIEKWLKIPFSSIAHGSTNVSTKINLAVNQPIEIHVETNLTGVSLDLPEQYAKTTDDVRQFIADITVEEKQPLKLKLNYADLLGAALVLDRNKDSFDLIGADLRLGKGDVIWPQGKGLYITGEISDLNTEKIKTYLDMSNAGGDLGLKLRVIDVVVNKLDLGSIKLTDARLQLIPINNAWSISITSPELAGKVDVPIPFTSKATIVADLQRINLNALTGGSTPASDVIAKQLPAIKFTADNVNYGNANLSNVSFNTTPSVNGLVIQSFSIRSSNLNLQGSGDWIQSGDNHATRLHGKANSSNVSQLLSSIGIDAHNFVAEKGDVDFDLNWNTAPSALSVAALSGSASIEIGKGRIVGLSQANDAKMDLGRMLNLFSLQSIPRRLSLDFSDVFSKGYAFDSLKADFNFNRGNANTSNMRFEGPLARVEIRGKIGLASKDFDMVLSITPYVTSSIPVAATLITGQPVIGVAAWAVNKMIGGEVSKVATYYYSVTGSWLNPDWKVISAPNRNAAQN